jgi:hypothetical protein
MRISNPKILWGFCCSAKALEQLIAAEQMDRLLRVGDIAPVCKLPSQTAFWFPLWTSFEEDHWSPLFTEISGALLLARSPRFSEIEAGDPFG